MTGGIRRGGGRLTPGRCAGSAALETAILFPILLLCIVGLIQFARMVWIQSTLDYAVQSGARCGALGATACLTADQIRTYVAARAPGVALTSADISVATPACGVEVSVTLPYQLAVPAMFSAPLSLRASACFPS